MGEEASNMNKWMNGLILGLWLLGNTSVVHADVKDLLSNLEPYITLETEYSSNINLTPQNRIHDLITTISPGLRFSTYPRLDIPRLPELDISIQHTLEAITQQGVETLRPLSEPIRATEKYGLDLDYRLGFVFYAKEEDNNFIGQEGTLNAWYTVGRNLTFGVTDFMIRSEEPREQELTPGGALSNEFLLGTQRQRSIYLRNVFEPSVEYRFGAEDRLSLRYRSNIYDNQSILVEDSRENFISPRLNYWFDIKNGVLMEYGLLFGDFERSPDLLGHAARARYIHRLNPRTSLFGEYIFLDRNFESQAQITIPPLSPTLPGIDYYVHAPTLGIEHAFSPATTGRVQLGYFWQDPRRGSHMEGPVYDILFKQRFEKTTAALFFEGGFREDFFTAENLGFAKFHRGTGAVIHQLKERLFLEFSGSGERAKFTDGRADWIWEVRSVGSYQILKWLTVALEGAHREDHSNNDGFDYSEYRGIFRITGTF
jgi:hypothetical protein